MIRVEDVVVSATIPREEVVVNFILLYVSLLLLLRDAPFRYMADHRCCAPFRWMISISSFGWAVVYLLPTTTKARIASEVDPSW